MTSVDFLTTVLGYAKMPIKRLMLFYIMFNLARQVEIMLFPLGNASLNERIEFVFMVVSCLRI